MRASRLLFARWARRPRLKRKNIELIFSLTLMLKSIAESVFCRLTSALSLRSNMFYAVSKGRQTGIFSTWFEIHQHPWTSFSIADFVFSPGLNVKLKLKGLLVPSTKSSPAKKRQRASLLAHPQLLLNQKPCHLQVVFIISHAHSISSV